MPTICTFRGIKIFMNYDEHNPPHFHASYSDYKIVIDINNIEVSQGEFPTLQLKMLLGWAAFHKEELLENWELAKNHKALFKIDPLR